MPQQWTGPELVSKALELWESGRLMEAESITREALERFPAGHWRLPDVRLQLASILDAQGRDSEARQAFQSALNQEVEQQGGDEKHPNLRVFRTVFGQHLVRTGEPRTALEVIRPALGQPDDGALRLIEADALVALGKRADALTALHQCLESTSSESLRNEIQRRVAALHEGKAGYKRLQPTAAGGIMSRRG